MASFSLFLKNRLACLYDLWIHAWYSFLRPVGSYSLRCALILSFILPNFLCFKAGAVQDVNGFFNIGIGYQKPVTNRHWIWKNNAVTGIELPMISSNFDTGILNEEEEADRVFMTMLQTNTGPLYGDVGVYLSFFYTGYNSSSYNYQWRMVGTPDYRLWLYDSTGNSVGTYNKTGFETFTPQTVGTAHFRSPGYRFSFRVDNAGTEDHYVQNPRIWNTAESENSYWEFDGTTRSQGSAGIAIPSFQVIATEKSGDLAALENIADAITAQNDILSAMYGDILAVCNSIYSRTGDMLQAQQLANEYFQQVIQKIAEIQSTTADIYSLLGNQFKLLIDTINSGVVSVTDAIASAELRLEQYLKPVIDYFNSLEETTGESASKLPGHKADLDNAVSSSSGIDTNAEQGFSAIWSMISQFELLLVCVGMWLGATIFLIVIKKGLS